MTPGETRCTRCCEAISDRTPSEGWTNKVRMTRTVTVVTWKLQLGMFRWRWLPERAEDRVHPTWSELDLCDWCAGDVFLFAQGKPPRARPSVGVSTST